MNDLSQPRATMLPGGLPDLFVAHPKWGDFWIEVKAPRRRNEKDGGLSTSQLAWHANARSCGMTVIVAYGWDDVQLELVRRGMDLR